ncbi:MAG: thioredoxin-dependent thiol peroxidase [Hyphomicrobiales bacterium]|nr:thioredoxin-dependent thiol peroxidase [Hyphomicrobiales bacterium]
MPRLGVPLDPSLSSRRTQRSDAAASKRPALGIVADEPVPLARSCHTKNIRPDSTLARIDRLPMDPEKGTKGRHMPITLAVGAKAPAFKLPRDGDETTSLADFKGRKLVLYFYPKADTPGCTKESIEFSKLKVQFQKADTEILGVSADPVAAQDKFKIQHKLTVGLASDEAHKMLDAYGVWGEKSMYGKTFMGITRATFLIDAEGRIARIWPKVKVEGHAAEVLAAANEL